MAAIRDDMVNADTDWVDQATVVDGNLISTRTPADLGPWMKALLAALEKAGRYPGQDRKLFIQPGSETLRACRSRPI